MHSFRQLDTADLSCAGFVRTPSRTAEIAADNHLHRITLATIAHRDHRIRSCQQPVRHDIPRGVEEFGSNLIQDLTLVRNTFRQNHIKSRDSIGGYHAKQVIAQKIDITHLTVIYIGLAGKRKGGFC